MHKTRFEIMSQGVISLRRFYSLPRDEISRVLSQEGVLKGRGEKIAGEGNHGGRRRDDHFSIMLLLKKRQEKEDCVPLLVAGAINLPPFGCWLVGRRLHVGCYWRVLWGGRGGGREGRVVLVVTDKKRRRRERRWGIDCCCFLSLINGWHGLCILRERLCKGGNVVEYRMR